MSQAVHPIEATNRVRDDYIRYLRTIYFFRDEELRRQFGQALDEPDFLVRGPLLEASPPFKEGRSLAQLITDGVLHPAFHEFCSAALPLERPLYLHQEQAIVKTVAQGRNVAVATGTGSGKTEAFLIPIFDYLLRQRAAGLLDQPGVRALLLYPMNALANDQMKRLRKFLAHFPAITFGRYTGETEEEQSKAEQRFREQFKEDPLPNELLSRQRMREGPPHILITNYAMLEYLLLRPRDSEFFDGETGQFWRFIVLDEAHTYDGAAGIEIAMLLRRLKDRVVRSTPGRLCCIATSATLGRGRQDFPEVAGFAGEIFGEPFEWVEDDPRRQDVVEGLREEMAALGPAWGEGSPELYGDLAQAIADGAGPEDLAVRARTHGVPETVVQSSLEAAAMEVENGAKADAVNRFLQRLLQGDQRLHALREQLRKPQLLADVVAAITSSATGMDAVVNLVRLAARARSHPEAVSLLPARYHVFARALEGAFVCLNAAHPAHAEEGRPRLFLTRHESCPHCQARVLELATCPRCGTAYIVGSEKKEPTPAGRRHTVLGHPTFNSEDPSIGLLYHVLTEQVQRLDEDDAVVLGQALEASEHLEPYALCLRCGAIGPREQGPPCTCGPTAPYIVLQRVTSTEDPLRRCVACGASSPGGIVFRFLTGRDAPVSVLATSLYQLLPPAEDEETAQLPGQGRKLLIFADSRQDAAFFAPYLERTYERILRRRLILKALLEDEDGRAGRLRLQDLNARVLREAEAAGLFTPDQSLDERRQTVDIWLMQEFTALDYRMSLEGQGLLHFRPVPAQGWQPPAPLSAPPWNLDRGQILDLLLTLLNSVRQQGAVTFPPNVDPRGDAFAPRNVQLYLRDYADEKQHVLGWLPRRGSNRRRDFLVRLLVRRAGMPREQAEDTAGRVLEGLWRHLTDHRSPWHDYLAPEQLARVGVVYRLNHRYWEWVPAVEMALPIYRCNRCFATSYVNLDGVCPAHGCDGTLEPVESRPVAEETNHYRALYQTLLPIPLAAEEHTAQWRPEEAGRIQERFIRGQVNVLSCSTTFELGVDVGELQAVLMRNVPPTTANYVQRAGRAGRRTDAVAFVLTFAQRRSHDLIHFGQPQRLVAGHIQPPVISVRNEKIVRRHVHSTFLAAFFRWAYEQHGRLFLNAGVFFAPDDGKPSGPDLLAQYVRLRPQTLQEALERIVPPEMQDALGIADWGWLSGLMNEQEPGILDKVIREVQEDLALYARLMEDAAAAHNFRLADHFQRVAQTVRGRELLGFLGTRNVLPKYGFPTDVVELRTYHIPRPEAASVELQRDLRVAISEYAPGGEVVAAKRIWTGGGLYRLPERDWVTRHYAVCPRCGRFHSSPTPLAEQCTVCQANLFGYPKRYGQFVIPEFGFIAGRETKETSENRPQRFYSSRVYFSDYDPGHEHEGESNVYEPVVELSGPAVQVARRYSRYGELALVNSGLTNSGFRICTTCGWAESAKPVAVGRRARTPAHENPRTGQPCTGRVETYHLGHKFITDVLEIRFTGALARPDNADLWLSTLYALLEAASETLGIARDDLDGTLYPYQAGLAPAIVLFDNVPGGAGHVRRIGQALPRVTQAAWERMARCKCGEETSCYECLRSFGNQYCHDQLRRGLVRDFLRVVMQQRPGGDSAAGKEA